MDKQNAQNLAETTLTDEFNRERFKKLIVNLLHNAKSETGTLEGTEISKAYRNSITSSERIARYTDPAGEVVGVLIVTLETDTSLERARTLQRNFIAWYLRQYDLDAVLVAFISPDPAYWRFSFVRPEYKLNASVAKLKSTSARRYSFLVGSGRQSHTAQQRLMTLLCRAEAPTVSDIQEMFAVEPLNKEFYAQIYKWYERAQELVQFPNDDERPHHTEISLIRLLTRIMFVWFIKEKRLISETLFDRNKLDRIINLKKPSSFYKAILQNLFFATLNTKIEDREFRESNGSYSKDYGDQYHYRYNRLVQDHSKWESLFSQTPFMNGGLFANLDYRLDKDNPEDKKRIDAFKSEKRNERTMIRVDGFSDRDDNPIEVPNELFFEDKDKDKPPGLIDIFKRYQFTIEESTPLDVEVALDPELLGRIFENLLATFNPETRESARKKTGSFYTPREIVNYMVDESLKQYLIQHTELTTEKIQKIFQDEDDDTLEDDEVASVVSAINKIKILDPACGSGAFPMGILQRLVSILALIDPQNEQYKKEQIAVAEQIRDSSSREAALHAIEETFRPDNRYNRYSRKLALIRDCIYGVDIQPVAIQIAKLRFFISLAIEQESNRDREHNYGIVPLPNLETKFVVADTLTQLKQTKQENLKGHTVMEIEDKIQHARIQHFSESIQVKKDAIIKTINQLRQQLQKELEREGFNPEDTERIATWSFQDQTKSADWFDPWWMFGTEGGFDIVIGNPPYKQVKNKKDYSDETFPYAQGIDTGKQNLYKLFVEQSYNLAKDSGIATLIVASSLLCDQSSAGTRQLLMHKTKLQHIIEFPKLAKDKKRQVFQSVLQGTCVYQFIKSLPIGEPIKISIDNDSLTIAEAKFVSISVAQIKKLYPELHYIPLIREGYVSILEKIRANQSTKTLIHFSVNIQKGDFNLGTYGNKISTSPTKVLLLRGRQITPFSIKHHESAEYCEAGFMTEKVKENAENDFLISQEISGTTDPRRLTVALNSQLPSKVLYGDTVCKILLKQPGKSKLFLGLLNSKFMDWFFRITSTNNHVMRYELKILPIPEITDQNRTIATDIEKLVNRILQAKAKGATVDAHPAKAQDLKADTTAIEAKIDALVYELYNLTDKEIGIIEGASR